jgi:hypothetical protein
LTASAGCLLDSNILLRTGKIEGVHFPEVEEALKLLSRAKIPLYSTSQALGEFGTFVLDHRKITGSD